MFGRKYWAPAPPARWWVMCWTDVEWLPYPHPHPPPSPLAPLPSPLSPLPSPLAPRPSPLATLPSPLSPPRLLLRYLWRSENLACGFKRHSSAWALYCIVLYGYRAWVKDESSTGSGGEQRRREKWGKKSQVKRKRKNMKWWDTVDFSPRTLCLPSSIWSMYNASHHHHPLYITRLATAEGELWL